MSRCVTGNSPRSLASANVPDSAVSYTIGGYSYREIISADAAQSLTHPRSGGKEP